jgi:AraC-like DNA-binding protein
MNVRLLVGTKLYREKFSVESFSTKNDILLFVKSGSFYFESEHGGYTVDENHCSLFKKGILYTRKIIKPLTFYLFRYVSDYDLFSKEHIVFSNTERIKSSFEILDMADRDRMRDRHLCYHHILMDLAYLHSLEERSCEPLQFTEDEVMENAAAMIQSKLLSDLSLADVAKRSGLSYVQFIRRFKAYTGRTPSEYLNEMRIQRAKSLLSDSGSMIREIAEACGFSDEYYFSNFFKKQTGYSPSAFRKTIL